VKGYTLLFSKADEISGISIVRIGTDMGEFEGIAECCFDDLPQFSNFFGCRIAELRASAKYAKAKIKYWRARLEALESYEGTMCATRNWNDHDYYVKKLHQHMKAAKNELDRWKLIYSTRQENITAAIAERDKYIAEMGARADDSIYG
jgi:hypothetical protein